MLPPRLLSQTILPQVDQKEKKAPFANLPDREKEGKLITAEEIAKLQTLNITTKIITTITLKGR